MASARRVGGPKGVARRSGGPNCYGPEGGGPVNCGARRVGSGPKISCFFFPLPHPFSGSGPSKTPPKFNEKTPREKEKERTWRKKKSGILCGRAEVGSGGGRSKAGCSGAGDPVEVRRRRGSGGGNEKKKKTNSKIHKHCAEIKKNQKIMKIVKKQQQNKNNNNNKKKHTHTHKSKKNPKIKNHQRKKEKKFQKKC